MNPKDINIVYIGGYGRSGSTLLDIMLGNLTSNLSCGEICFLPENGIRDNEFCSCGARVLDCEFWEKVIDIWNKSRILSNQEYISYYKNNFRNKRFFSFMKNFLFPGKRFKSFSEDTRKLYEVIWVLGKNKTIIDSSKSPYRLLLLKKIGFNIKIIHVVRSIKGVLYSTSKYLKLNPESGIERDISPRNKSNVLFTWTFTNILMIIFSLGSNRVRITYEALLKGSPEWLHKIAVLDLKIYDEINLSGPFFPGHLVAGGRVRMNKTVFIDNGLLEQENYKASGLTNVICNFLDQIFK